MNTFLYLCIVFTLLDIFFIVYAWTLQFFPKEWRDKVNRNPNTLNPDGNNDSITGMVIILIRPSHVHCGHRFFMFIIGSKDQYLTRSVWAAVVEATGWVLPFLSTCCRTVDDTLSMVVRLWFTRRIYHWLMSEEHVNFRSYDGNTLMSRRSMCRTGYSIPVDENLFYSVLA